MNYLGLFAWSFGVAIGPVVSPGPISTAIVTEGVRRGFRVGPLVSTGHALMELAMVGALALGMGQVLRHPALAAGVGILGGLFLLWMGGTMGWGALRHKPRLPRPGEDSVAPLSRSLIGLGVATTVGNPFWYVWWIGVGGGYVLASGQQGLIALAAFYLGHISADYAWNTLLATVVASGRRWLNDRVYQALLVVCGAFLVYTGLQFIWAGIGTLGG
jgi:threonine/homoserine/homoserine lactone efflux protein